MQMWKGKPGRKCYLRAVAVQQKFKARLGCAVCGYKTNPRSLFIIRPSGKELCPLTKLKTDEITCRRVIQHHPQEEVIEQLSKSVVICRMCRFDVRNKHEIPAMGMKAATTLVKSVRAACRPKVRAYRKGVIVGLKGKQQIDPELAGVGKKRRYKPRIDHHG